MKSLLFKAGSSTLNAVGQLIAAFLCSVGVCMMALIPLAVLVWCLRMHVEYPYLSLPTVAACTLIWRHFYELNCPPIARDK